MTKIMKVDSVQFFYSIAAFGNVILIPLLASELGGNEYEIGMVVGIYNCALFLSSYLFGRLSDIYDKRTIIIFGLIASALSFFLHVFISSLFTLAAVRCLAGFCMGIFPSALVAYVYESKMKFGRFLSFGPFGAFVGSLIVGIIGIYSRIFMFSSVALLISFLFAISLKPIKSERIKVPKIPLDLVKHNLKVYLPFFIRHSSAHAIWVILPLFIIQLGGNKMWIGALYAINFFFQFIFMNLLERVKTSRLMGVGFLSSFLTFLAFSYARSIYHLIPIEIMLGFSWSTLFIGMNLYLLKTNKEHSTAIGLLGSVQSFSIICGSFIGGYLAYVFDYRIAMLLASIFTVIAFILNRVL